MPDRPGLKAANMAPDGELPRGKCQRLRRAGKKKKKATEQIAELQTEAAQCDERIADIDRQFSEARQNREELQLKKAAEQKEPRAVFDRLTELAKASLPEEELESEDWKKLTGACNQMIVKIDEAFAKKFALNKPPAEERPPPTAELPDADGMETDEEEQQLEQEFEKVTAKHISEVEREVADPEALRAMSAKLSELNEKRRKIRGVRRDKLKAAKASTTQGARTAGARAASTLDAA